MKSLILLVLFLGSRANAQLNLGSELQLAVNPDGKYQLGVHYSYDSGVMGNSFEINWGLLFGTTISPQELSKLPANIKWNIYSQDNSAFVFDWQVQPLVSKNLISFGSIDAVQKQAKYLIGHQTKTVLVFADVNGNALYHLNIGKLCTELPTYFNNITESEKKCSQMTESQIDSTMKQFCSEKEAELLSYVKDGLLRCEVAAKNFDAAGCGILRCE